MSGDGRRKGMLILEDGTQLEGEAFGWQGSSAGEVVFNTGMTGYQEVLTDPSYCGQIVTMTYPLIGNYGINDDDFQSVRPYVQGLLVRELCAVPSHWQSRRTLDEYLYEQRVVGLAGIDTRALTRYLRARGTMGGVLTTGDADPTELISRARAVDLRGAVKEVTTPQPYKVFGDGPRVVVMDFGIKRSILRSLQAFDCEVVVVPATFRAEQILDCKPDGILLASGPGDPRNVPEAVAAVRALIGRKPIFGICLGHQILARALGADTYKLKYGHRGANHPVRDLATGRVYITSQNHGYAIDEGSLASLEVEVTHKNLNDGTVEGLRHLRLPIFSVQYHPEAGPGPEDSFYLFEHFLRLMGISTLYDRRKASCPDVKTSAR